MNKAERIKAGRRHVGALYQKPHIAGWFFRTAQTENSDTVERVAFTYNEARKLRSIAIAEFAEHYK